MPDKQSELAIIIEAVNNASKKLKEVENDLGNLADTTTEQGKQATKAGDQFSGLVGTIAMGNIVAMVATKAMGFLSDKIQDLNQYLQDSIDVASEYNRSLTGLARISQRFGESQDEATIAARELASDGLITVSTAAEGLQKLMQGGLNLGQAAELMANYKNEAAFGRAKTIEYDQAVRNLSESFYTENSMIGNLSGQTENWNILIERGAELLGKKVDELTKAERAQAKYLAQQELSLLTEGDAIEYADTYAGKVSQLENAHKELKDTLGNVFLPTLREIMGVQGGIIESINEWAKTNADKLREIVSRVGGFVKKVIAFGKELIDGIPWGWLNASLDVMLKNFVMLAQAIKVVGNVVQAMARGFVVAANSLGALGTAVGQFISGDFEALRQTYYDWEDQTAQTGESILNDFGQAFEGVGSILDAHKFNLQDWWSEIEGIDRAGFDSKLDAIDRYGNELSQKQKEQLAKIQEQIEKENKSYAKAVKDRVRDFEENYEDLILKHRDKIEELTDDLADENKDYKKQLIKLKDSYDDVLSDIEKRHHKKTESILDDLEEEKEKAEEKIKALVEDYNEEKEIFEREGNARVDNLKSQLIKEKALGEHADQEKISALEEMIAFEQEGLADALDDKEEKHDEEVNAITEALEKKLEKIREELDAENQEYADALAKRKDQYDEDVQAAKDSYEEKRIALQDELDQEKAIREKYAEDFEALKNKIADDDITRMVKTHEREMEEMRADHEEKLAEIKKDGFEQGKGFGDSFADGIAESYPQVDNQVSKIGESLASLTQAYNDYQKTMNWVDKYAPWNVGAYPSGGAGGGGGGGGAYAYGGLASTPGIVGEAGPEVVLPLNFPSRMASIMKSMGLGGGGGGKVTQNFYVTVNNKQDIDVLMERAGYAMEHQGGLT